MTVVDDDIQRLWTLVVELSSQLSENRELAARLQAQADDLKGQAFHNTTGYALRRFNTDVSKEEFESELEQLNANLVLENQALQHENKQLSQLLKEYENTLETVMAKFRAQSHASQQHALNLTRHYESLLASSAHNLAAQSLSETTSNSLALSHLSHLVRNALRTLEGEDPEAESGDEEEWRREGQGGYIGRRTGSSVGGLGAGDTGPTGGGDKALEWMIEMEKLEEENRVLRELLQLQNASSAAPTTAPAPAPAAGQASPRGPSEENR